MEGEATGQAEPPRQNQTRKGGLMGAAGGHYKCQGGIGGHMLNDLAKLVSNPNPLS